jgi:hypothetical protein
LQVTEGLGAHQEPAIGAVVAADAVLDLEHAARCRRGKGLQGALCVLGVNVVGRDVARRRRQVRRADVGGPLTVEELQPAGRIGDPHDQRRRVGHQPEASLALAQRLVGPVARDVLGGRPGQQVDQPKFVVRGPVRLGELGAEHADQFAVPADHRRGLGRPDPGRRDGRSVRGPHQAWKTDRFLDDQPLPVQAGGLATRGETVVAEVLDERTARRVATLAHDLQAVAARRQQLDGASVRVGEGHGGVEDLVQRRSEVRPAGELGVHLVESAHAREIGGEPRLAFPKRDFRALADRDVGEQDRHLSRRAGREGFDLKPRV